MSIYLPGVPTLISSFQCSNFLFQSSSSLKAAKRPGTFHQNKLACRQASLPDEVSQTSLHLQGTCRVDLGRKLKMFKVWMAGMIQTNEQLRASAVLGTGRLTSLQSRLPWLSSGV